jgi:hypothetical protein
MWYMAWMCTIHDIGWRCNKHIFIFNTQLKIDIKNTNFNIMDEHKKCHMSHAILGQGLSP